MIRLAGDDPATGPRAGASRNHRLAHYLRHAAACRRPVNHDQAQHAQAAPL
jgi:hypothetical protein